MDKDELTGEFKQAKGTVKEKAGELTDNPDLEAEGTADKVGGHLQEGFGAAKRKVRDTVDDITDDE